MAKKIHVHVHGIDRNSPAGRAEFNRVLAASVTRDSDEGGRWVTIHGAHVHIGGDGAIDKGPKHLVGKTEHGAHANEHAEKASHHRVTGKAKREEGDHEAAYHHDFAASAHAHAARLFGESEQHAKVGNVKAARKSHEEAKKMAASAETHEANLKAHLEGKKAEAPKFVKPKTHEAIHNEAADDVKGSEKHEAEHKRLMGLYDSSKADWERTATNRLIQKNQTEAVQHKAQDLHHKALAASEHAKRTTDPLDHHQASESLQRAIDAHGKAGGVGYVKKQEELAKAKKHHDAELARAEKASGKSSKSAAQEHGEYAVLHEDAARNLRGLNDEAGAKAHEDASKLHRLAQHGHVHGSDELRKMGHAGGVSGATKKAHEATTALWGTGPDGKPGRGHGAEQAGKNAHKLLDPGFKKTMHPGQRKLSGAGFDNMAKRAAERAGKEAADEDPKHKK